MMTTQNILTKGEGGGRLIASQNVTAARLPDIAVFFCPEQMVRVSVKSQGPGRLLHLREHPSHLFGSQNSPKRNIMNTTTLRELSREIASSGLNIADHIKCVDTADTPNGGCRFYVEMTSELREIIEHFCTPEDFVAFVAEQQVKGVG